MVHATGGDRSRYRHLKGSFLKKSEPHHVVLQLLKTIPFRTLYIADLDAIEGRKPHYASIAKISEYLDGIASIWLDSGIRYRKDLENFSKITGILPVVGSETIAQPIHPEDCPTFVLSLDFIQGQLLCKDPGLKKHLLNPQCWPERVLLLSLDRIGTCINPNPLHYQWIKQHTASHSMFVGGGIGNTKILPTLAAYGARGVLVGTALYKEPQAFADWNSRQICT